MRKRIILLILIVLNLATIFFFSHQDSKASKAVSNVVSREIEMLTPNYTAKNQVERNILHANMHSVIRQGAHGFLFFCLGILSFLFLRTFPMKWFWYFLNLSFGFLIALSDEIHQLYVPGRTFGWNDISYDMAGFLLGMVITCLVISIIQWIRFKKQKTVKN